jgi:hypothetical protein
MSIDTTLTGGANAQLGLRRILTLTALPLLLGGLPKRLSLGKILPLGRHGRRCRVDGRPRALIG